MTIRIRLLGSYLSLLLVTGTAFFACLSNIPASPYPRQGGTLYLLCMAMAIAMVILLVSNYLLIESAARSLCNITAFATRFGNGGRGDRIAVLNQDELGTLARAMNDMAERVERRMDALAAEKNQLDTILRGMGEGVMVTDTAGTITMVNPAFLALFSIREEVGKKPFIAITRHPSFHDAFKKVITTRSERLEEITLELEGGKTLLTHWTPLTVEEELQGVVAVFHDISNQKRLEKMRRDFVANVSHELRTPVTVIKGYAETLISGALKSDIDRAGRFVEIIHNHAERLATLIADLLALSELESGDLTLDLAPFPIASTIRRSCGLLEQKARDKEITINWNGIEKTPPVMADPCRIEQVLINLLDNAIKYTPEKGSVAISAKEKGAMVTIEIMDNGIGIPPQDQPRIFERFYRVNKARSGEQGGTGLGLSIVKHIVQLHGGAVSVESTPGKGSVFSFTLKAA